MIKNLVSLVLIILIIIPFNACNGGNDEDIPIDDSLFKDDQVVVSEAEIDEIIQSLPSPAEISALIQDLGVPFSKSYLASPEQADDYDTNFKKALGLGILSSDLGYLNVYSQTNETVNYLATIRKISDDLNVGQFFDFQTLKRLVTNNEDPDSLMILSQRSFRQMDSHLRKNKRSNLSALVVTGVWIEGLYLITQIVKDGNKSDELKEKIGDQKVIVEMLNKVLQVYKVQDKNFEQLATDFEELKLAYEGVEITYETGGVKVITLDDGTEVVVPEDKSIVTITEDQINAIVELAESIRNKLISL
jgi:hypothetical protein